MINMHFDIKKIMGFTLSEVLITLGIIGVVAALSIPTLIQANQKTQTETQLKKAYAEITQLFKNIMVDKGCMDLMCTGLFDSSLSVDDFQNQMETEVKNHMKIAQTCKNSDADNTLCQETLKRIKDNTNTTSVNFKGTAGIVFVSVDGLKFQIENSSGCTSTAYPDASKIKNNCAWVSVDINSNKPPNIKGKDYFGLGTLNQNGDIYPDTSVEYAKSLSGEDWASSTNYWRNGAHTQCGDPNKTISQSSSAIVVGQNCLARIIENNWKIDYWD